MTLAMAEILSDFLNRKYNERIRRGYTIRKFAEEIGIDEKTFLAMLNLKHQPQRIDLVNMQKLSEYFGVEFLEVVGMLPTDLRELLKELGKIGRVPERHQPR